MNAVRRRWRSPALGRTRLAVVPSVLLVVALASLVILPPTAPSGASGRTSQQKFATSSGFTLSLRGAAPASLGLSWSTASDLLFAGYAVYFSTVGASGPWTSVAAIADRNASSFYVKGLTPGASYWWKVTYNDSLMGTQSSNVVSVVLPPIANLSATMIGPATARVNWTDSADYSGFVTFVSYQILVQGDNGTVVPIGTLTNLSQRSIDVPSLANNTTYQFRVATSDGCSGASNCASRNLVSATNSSSALLSTPRSLSATVAANASTIVFGSKVTLTCSAIGGVAPYSLSWRLGDGTASLGAQVSHRYDRTGSFSPQCRVTDRWGSTTSAVALVNVTPLNTTGGGSSGSGGGPPPPTGGSGGTPPPSGGPSPPGSGSIVPSVSGRSVLGPIAAAILVATLVAIVAWLAIAARRQHRANARPEPPTLVGDGPPGDDRTADEPSSAPAAVAADAGAEPAREPVDLDRLMDELENGSTEPI